MPIGERFCLSFFLLKLTQKMEFSPHTIRLLFFGSLAAGTETAISKTSWHGGWFSLSPLFSAFCSQLALLFHYPHSLLAGLPYGQLGLRFMLVFFCFTRTEQFGPFTGHTAVAASPGEGIQPAQGARENIRSDTSQSKKRARRMGSGGRERGGRHDRV